MKSSKNVRYNVYAPKAERNHVTHLNRATRSVYPLGSQFKLPRGTSSLEQMRLLGHVITGSQFKLPRGTSSLEQMRLLGHVITGSQFKLLRGTSSLEQMRLLGHVITGS